MPIYEPREDSFLLQKYVRQLAEGRVLDMGTGSGIQALTAANLPNVKEVVAVDISRDAVAYLQQIVHEKKLRKMTVQQGDLFTGLKGQFNVIFCNPPYLPQDKGIEDAAIYGGIKGWEWTERFFSECSRYLFPDGLLFFLFSSLTNKKKVEEIIDRHLFRWQECERQKLAFEELYVYRIEKSALLRTLEGKGLSAIAYFTKGKRGLIYTGIYNKAISVKSHFAKPQLVKVAIKVQHPDSKALGKMRNEAEWLQRLNAQGIGPRFLFSGEDYVIYEFVEGQLLLDWLKEGDTFDIKRVLIEVLQQCFILDKTGVTKEEMHHPFKHIIIQQSMEPVLLDFERCSSSEKPQNVTQFVEAICRLHKELGKRKIVIEAAVWRSSARAYKELRTKESFETIIKLLR